MEIANILTTTVIIEFVFCLFPNYSSFWNLDDFFKFKNTCDSKKISNCRKLGDVDKDELVQHRRLLCLFYSAVYPLL
jgi:hypothetical protein